MSNYHNIMSKYLDSQMDGKTDKGKEDLLKIVRDIGNKTSLADGLALSKALIENYFLNENCSNPIIELIDKTVEIQNMIRRGSTEIKTEVKRYKNE